MAPIAVKVRFQSSLRRFNISPDAHLLSFADLESEIRTLHWISVPIIVTYQDEDGDEISFDTDSELRDLLAQLKRTGSSTLRLNIAVNESVVSAAPSLLSPVPSNVQSPTPSSLLDRPGETAFPIEVPRASIAGSEPDPLAQSLSQNPEKQHSNGRSESTPHDFMSMAASSMHDDWQEVGGSELDDKILGSFIYSPRVAPLDVVGEPSQIPSNPFTSGPPLTESVLSEPPIASEAKPSASSFNPFDSHVQVNIPATIRRYPAVFSDDEYSSVSSAASPRIGTIRYPTLPLAGSTGHDADDSASDSFSQAIETTPPAGPSEPAVAFTPLAYGKPPSSAPSKSRMTASEIAQVKAAEQVDVLMQDINDLESEAPGDASVSEQALGSNTAAAPPLPSSVPAIPKRPSITDLGANFKILTENLNAICSQHPELSAQANVLIEQTRFVVHSNLFNLSDQIVGVINKQVSETRAEILQRVGSFDSQSQIASQAHAMAETARLASEQARIQALEMAQRASESALHAHQAISEALNQARKVYQDAQVALREQRIKQKEEEAQRAQSDAGSVPIHIIPGLVDTPSGSASDARVTPGMACNPHLYSADPTAQLSLKQQQQQQPQPQQQPHTQVPTAGRPHNDSGAGASHEPSCPAPPHRRPVRQSSLLSEPIVAPRFQYPGPSTDSLTTSNSSILQPARTDVFDETTPTLWSNSPFHTPTPPHPLSTDDTNKRVNALVDMGFTDRELNHDLVVQYGGDLGKCVELLTEMMS
ncbi:uncharacterized protein BJ171DRAFT_487178 [Polychytrium aggregatum]|uniref:uncharacterized protein n=1 Tax=Polychytrium aggregatum TaxID=110093 RepID=UPI0022FE643A|nr:uncharacterized protein BJ171DRAFT_487178 [Polychytrium aggregatum]KAI9209495.1 hypothetical protein BJ171DRAFT_487178 [Polychytrium aggregatum]